MENMKISKTPLLDVATKAARQGIATARFRIMREQAELRRIEADSGQESGLRYVLKLLAAKRISSLRKISPSENSSSRRHGSSQKSGHSGF